MYLFFTGASKSINNSNTQNFIKLAVKTLISTILKKYTLFIRRGHEIEKKKNKNEKKKGSNSLRIKSCHKFHRCKCKYLLH